MIVRNVTLEKLNTALDVVNEAFEGNVIWNRSPEKAGRGYRLTLRVKDSKGSGHKIGYSGRRTIHACWHVHGTFFDALPDEAVIRAGDSVVHPHDEWKDRNVGSIMYPLMYSDACECGHTIQFSRAEMIGNELKTATVRYMKQSDIMKCPFCILVPEHYRADGTCKCDDAEHRKMMIREWDYTKEDFAGIPLKEA